ncbi:MAG: tRNA-queuosine alpha-mannosyltransferase domain-containing protein [Planctomycetota bacterium]
MGLRLLFLDAYHGDSHAAFALGWQAHSRHRITVETLPPHHWKWRMRSAGAAFAGRITAGPPTDQDAIVCSSMCDLAQWRALCPRRLAQLPHILYMHENQCAYPDGRPDARDIHFPLTQWTACLAADTVWWNSAWNRDSFLAGMQTLLRSMPDRHLPGDWAARIRARSLVLPPGIDTMPVPEPRDPPTICWVGRWEADKRPEIFFQALERLQVTGSAFQLAVLGRSYRQVPACFAQARTTLSPRIRHWGWCDDPAAYRQVLASARIVVSSAAHEFFGIAVVEAAAAGCIPVVPQALSYPEIFDETACYHDGSAADLARVLAAVLADPRLDTGARDRVCRHYAWPRRAAALDAAVEELCA